VEVEETGWRKKPMPWNPLRRLWQWLEEKKSAVFFTNMASSNLPTRPAGDGNFHDFRGRERRNSARDMGAARAMTE
jgi:hypothetical protein